MLTNTYQFTVQINKTSAKEYVHNGTTYIEGRKGSEYSLIYRNRTNVDQLVILSVDGLSVMDGKPAGPNSNGYVIPPFGAVCIPGWRIDDTKVAAFKFSPQSDNDQTYVEKLAQEGFNVSVENQGNIGVMVFNRRPVNTISYVYKPNIFYDTKGTDATWRNATQISAGPSSTFGYGLNNTTLSASGSTTGTFGQAMNASASFVTHDSYTTMEASAGLGTAFGEDKEFKTTTTTFDRDYSPVSVGVIVYDTLTGLKKRGVIVNNTGVSGAFPGYNPGGCYVPTNR